MPAKKEIPAHEIQTALMRRGGAVAAAARALGVSRSTLHRRLREHPDLKSRPENLWWERAVERTREMEKAAARTMFSPNVGAWSRLYRYIDWDEFSAGLDEPELLHPSETVALLEDLMRNSNKFRATPKRDRDWL